MQISALPGPDLTGWRVIPDLTSLRPQYQKLMGQAAGDREADAVPLTGWKVVFDLRLDGSADGFVCERPKPDGSVSSVVWNAADISRFFPPLKQETA